MRVYIFEWRDLNLDDRKSLIVAENKDKAIKAFEEKYAEQTDENSGWSTHNISLKWPSITNLTHHTD